MINIFWVIMSVGKTTLALAAICSLNFWVSNILIILVLVLQFKKFRVFTDSLVAAIFLSIHLATQLKFTKLSISLPTSLWVGTINWHPPLFYCIIVLSIVSQLARSVSYSSIISKTSYFLNIKLLSITLILGSLWSLQSLTWGYYWVNDTIEWALLSVLLVFLIEQHRNKTSYRKFYNDQSFILILILLLCLRLNLVPTRHAFLTSTPLIYKLLFSYIVFLCLTSKNLITIIFKKLENVSMLNLSLNCLIILLLLGQSVVSLFLKIIVIAFTLGIINLFFILQLSKSQTTLHYILVLSLQIWILPYSMYTLAFLNKHNVEVIQSLIYSTVVKVGTRLISKKKLKSLLLENINLFAEDTLSNQFVLSFNVAYILNCINGLEFLIIFLCLIF